MNTFGFLNHSRYLPDRRDLNRCFPGSPNGSRCSLGIDLHSAAINRMNLPLVRISANNRYTLDLAHVFGAPVILTSALRDGGLRQEVKKLGVDVLLYEAGEGMRFEEMSVRAGVAGILRVLKSTGMLPLAGIAGPRAKSLLCSRSTWLRAPTGGLLRMFKAKGDVVKENEVVTRYSGIIVGRAVMPVVYEGDALIHVAPVKSSDIAEAAVGDLVTQLEAAPLFDEDEII